MYQVTEPAAMNTAFARAFNSRSIDTLLALYEDAALLCADASGATRAGRAQISGALGALLALPGTMESRNLFCLVAGELALLRAVWSLVSDDGTVLASGSSAEVIRRQASGEWRYVIDHAVGASMPDAG